MKKISVVLVALFALIITTNGQAMRDRQVIPVAVNLNQVLRMTITNGGNIEFVFNSIDDYRDGLSAEAGNPGDAFYQTDFTIASSTRWKLTYGSEQATFIGTDNPANALDLDNVGFYLDNTGTRIFENVDDPIGTTLAASLFSAPTNNGNEVAALQAYPIDLIEDNNSADVSNAGDATENSFSLLWRAGTVEAQGETTPMNAVSILNQQPSPSADRYVTNVIFELSVDN